MGAGGTGARGDMRLPRRACEGGHGHGRRKSARERSRSVGGFFRAGWFSILEEYSNAG
jgi:hypothetical protein